MEKGAGHTAREPGEPGACGVGRGRGGAQKRKRRVPRANTSPSFASAALSNSPPPVGGFGGGGGDLPHEHRGPLKSVCAPCAAEGIYTKD